MVRAQTAKTDTGANVGYEALRSSKAVIESLTFGAVRDALLSKLIFGELPVRDAKKITGQAT